MKIETSEIRSGGYLGEKVWICHYLRPDLNKKPLRNVPPIKVVIRCIDELPKNERVYYSQCYFSPIGSNGKVSSKVISPVDNTGFRSRPGNELYVFTTESECIKEWNDQIDRACSELEKMELTAAQQWKDQKDSLKRTKVL